MENLDLLELGQYYTSDYLKQTRLIKAESFNTLYDLVKRDDLTSMSKDVIKLNPLDRSSVYEVVKKGLLPQDVLIQDQTSRLVDRFLTIDLNEITLASDVSFGDTIMELEAGHGFTDPPTSITPETPTQMIEIEFGGIQFQSRVISVESDVITVSNPLCCDIPAGTTGKRVSPDCNVDATDGVIAYTSPPTGVEWDINILCVNMLDQSAMDDSTFGGLPAPLNGVVYRTINTTMAENIFTAVDNSCFIRHCDTENPYSNKAPSGYYGFNSKRRFNGQQGDGVSRRIGGDYHRFEVVLQDDLSGLSRFWNVIRGHVVI